MSGRRATAKLVQAGPQAPAHLEAATAEWWVSVVTTWELDQHHVRLLTLACEAWDECQKARVILARRGLTYKDRWEQPKPRPEVKVEADARIAFARLIRELDLDVEPPPERGRPPHLGIRR